MSFLQPKLSEIIASSKIADNGAVLFSDATGASYERYGSMTLRQIQRSNKTWAAEDMKYGLTSFILAANSESCILPIYSEDEIKENPRLATVNLLYMPAEKRERSTTVILMSGGAYGVVCNLCEALPVAAKLNELGFSVFCLNYRTAVKEDFENGLLPQPLDDLASAIRFLDENSEKYGFDINNYIAGGFSAGGHIASLWGTQAHGARKYGLTQPKMLMLAYPLISMANVPDGSVKKLLCSGMFGKDYTDEDINTYSAKAQSDAAYPAVYLIKCADDTTVPARDAEDFIEKLKSLGVSCIIEVGKRGGHGFGLGSKTDMRGWVERAVGFFDMRA